MTESLFPMSDQELRERYDHLRKLVAVMRSNQKKYFAAPYKSDEKYAALIASKACESLVDKFLEQP